MRQKKQQPYLHENWYEYSESEINKVKERKCSKCPYRGRVPSYGGLSGVTCDYILITKKMREERPERCQHYKDKGVVYPDAPLF